MWRDLRVKSETKGFSSKVNKIPDRLSTMKQNVHRSEYVELLHPFLVEIYTNMYIGQNLTMVSVGGMWIN